ncbi:ABC-three component system middle component 1 [Xanthomarina gelatinilytica]|uniref:ABC-three component system middle component 1 n=1 Tax=Xanthomarina gelatinilytica TaxID=1137281 RepID=UPI003AA901CF
MKRIIEKIFSFHDFEKTNFRFGTFFKKNGIENNIAYYWLCVEVEDLNIVLEKQDEWFNDLKEMVEEKNFDKNTSLLILINNIDTTKRDVLKIEEDPYQFKKHVLSYSNEALENLNEKTNNGDTTKILELLINEDVFKEYKENHDQFTWHNLLFEISQKIPFIKLNIHLENGLDNLFQRSKVNLEKIDLYKKYVQMETILEENNFDDLRGYDYKNFMELINEEEE